MKFKAWKRCDKNNTVLNSYKKFIINFNPSSYETKLNLKQSIQHLKNDELQRVQEAALLLHMVFPNMFKTIWLNILKLYINFVYLQVLVPYLYHFPQKTCNFAAAHENGRRPLEAPNDL